MGKIIGRVTMSKVDASFVGARFLVAVPAGPEDAPDYAPLTPLPLGSSFVVYDNLGATVGDLIGYTDGGEAAAPFVEDTPCDAYNAAILDRCNYQPPRS
ncbi:MAG: ethanolamine utilization protein EutN [Verrucomicrobia bacterium]|nr:ethanolamine utilization protein EutN [Verrucomicrobiota bacterium]